MADQLFKASIKQVDGLTMSAKAREFEVRADEPVDLGGNNEAMTPVELLLSALGTCKMIVATLFASKNRIKLNNIEIDLEGTLNPDGLSGKDPDAKLGFSKIVTKYKIDADNSDEEIEKFVEFIENNCPVLDTIVNTPEIESEIL